MGYSGGYCTVEWGQISKEVISPHNRFLRKIIIFKLAWPVCFRARSYRKAFLPRSHTQGRTVGIGLITNRKGVSLQGSPHDHYNSYCVFYSWRFKDFLKIQSSSNIFISIHNIRVLTKSSFLKTSIPLWHVIRRKSMRPTELRWTWRCPWERPASHPVSLHFYLFRYSSLPPEFKFPSACSGESDCCHVGCMLGKTAKHIGDRLAQCSNHF